MPAKKKTKDVAIDLNKEIIQKIDVSKADSQDFLDYSMTVASDRALPNVRDGLKPIHRYILIAMNDLKLNAKAKTIKSQKVEGDVMGKYSPHAGSYLSIDYLTQNYVFHLPPVHGEGNFSTIDGSTPGAARYTEVRNSKYGDMFIQRTSKDLVPYTTNYDNTIEIPQLLAVDFPSLLINGVKTGIAVGFTSSIAPHNPVDAVKLTTKFFKNPKMTLDEAIEIIKGPDLPTGGVLIGDVHEYYETGEGHFVNQGTIIDDPTDKNTMIITEVPYGLGGSADKYILNVQTMISENALPGITKIEDYSNENGLKIEVTLQSNMDHDEARKLLFAKTELQKTYSLSWMALDNKTPKMYTLMSYLQTYSSFQHTMMIKEFKRVERISKKRLNIVNGLITVPDRITDLIFAAQNTSGKDELEKVLTNQMQLKGLSKPFSYNQEQAETLSAMRIYQLNKVSAEQYVAEKADLENKIHWAIRYQSDFDLRVELLTGRHEALMEHLKKDGFDKRKTTLLGQKALKDFAYTASEVAIPLTISINKYNYIKATDRLKTTPNANNDMLIRYNTDSSDILCVFTNKGNMYQLPLNKLKKFTTRDKSNGETVYAAFAKQGLTTNENIIYYTFRSMIDTETSQLIFVSKNGLAKRVNTLNSSLITKSIRSKVQAYKPKADDELMFIDLIQTNDDLQNKYVVALRETFVKKIPYIEIKEQTSMAGAGANTFKGTGKGKDEPLTQIIIMNETVNSVPYDHFGQEIDLTMQPIMKLSQAFKPIIKTLKPKRPVTDESESEIMPDNDEESTSDEE